MDRKTILAVLLCILFWVVLNAVINKYFPPTPLPPGSTNTVSETQTTTTLTNAPGPAESTNVPAPPAPRLIVNTNVAEQLLVVTNRDGRYTFTSHGGGIRLIELVQYPEAVGRKKVPLTSRLATLNARTVAPVLSILDGEAVQGDGIFELTRTAAGVRAEKTLSNGLTIVKEFQVDTNYLLSATVRFENHSAEPMALPAQEWAIGAATPMNAQDRGTYYIGLMWYNGEKTASILGGSYFSSSGFMCMPRTPPTEYREGQTNVSWAAVYNQYFTLAVMAKEPALQVVARRVDLPRPDVDDLADNPQTVRLPEAYETRLVYPALTLATNQVVQKEFSLYAGPKEYQTLSRIAAKYNNNLDAVMNFGWAGFFAKALLLGMNWLHNALRLSYGWAIIAITVIIKLLFWPLTQASNRSMKQMQALAPEVKALKEKYKDDLQKFFQKQRELYRKHNVSQMGGCLPMLIQIPVFFGLYGMIRTAIELRGASFLWIPDLSKPDTLFVIPGLNLPFNLLPIVYIATALWQSHLTPPSPGMDPTQQKLIRWMPVIFLAILYNFSSGLALYMTVQNLLTIAQTKMMKNVPVVAPAKAPVLTPPQKKKK